MAEFKKILQRYNACMISVIVPVYNVEKYLSDCIKSILRQKYTDFELILVDDGSPDRCGEICDEFAKLDRRVRVLHLKNGGVSRARNAGIEEARGEWIMFIDSDDLVTPHHLSDLVQFSENVDIVVQGLLSLRDGVLTKESFAVSRVAALNELVDTPLLRFRGPYAKLFRASIIKNNAIRFDERLTYGEDAVFYYSYLIYVRYVRISTFCSYIYRQGRLCSATSRKHDPRSLFLFIENSVGCLKIVYSKCGEDCPYPDQDQLLTLKALLVQTFAFKYSYSDFRTLWMAIRDSRDLDVRHSEPKGISNKLFFWGVTNLPCALLYLFLLTFVALNRKSAA